MDMFSEAKWLIQGVLTILISILFIYVIEQFRLKKVLRYQELKPVRDMKKFHKSEIENKLISMDDREFEIFITKLFKSQGYDAEVTKATGDGGKDVVVKNYRKYGTTYVECKHFKDGNNVSRPILQKLIGACIVDNVTHAIIVTTSGYTKECVIARDRCKYVYVELWYMDDIVDMILKNEECKDKIDTNDKLDNLVALSEFNE